MYSSDNFLFSIGYLSMFFNLIQRKRKKEWMVILRPCQRIVRLYRDSNLRPVRHTLPGYEPSPASGLRYHTVYTWHLIKPMARPFY